MERVLYCPQCGKSMRVADQHTKTRIACPHCGQTFRPAAITRLGGRGRGKPHEIAPQHATSLAAGSEPKSRLVAGFLGVFFGGLGLHRFYLGYTGVGFLQLGLALAGLFFDDMWVCCIPFVAVWGFIEGIFCLLGWMGDAQGRPLGP